MRELGGHKRVEKVLTILLLLVYASLAGFSRNGKALRADVKELLIP